MEIERETNSNKISAVVIGGTGAVGSALVDAVLSDDTYTEICIIARRKLEKWDYDVNKHKIKFIKFKFC